MQEQHMDHIAALALGYEQMTKNQPHDMLRDVSLELTADMIRKETTNLPEGQRTPTDTEVKKMQTYAAEYKRKNVKASHREVSRAVKRKFNVTILPTT